MTDQERGKEYKRNNSQCRGLVSATYLGLSEAEGELRHLLSVLRDHILNWPEAQKKEFTVEDAQLLHVCRICKKPSAPEPDNPFMLNYGKEYAHQKCLERKEKEMCFQATANVLKEYYNTCKRCEGLGETTYNGIRAVCPYCKNIENTIAILEGKI